MKKSILLSLLAVPLLNAAEFKPETVAAKAAWYLHTDMESLRETDAGKMGMAILAAEAGDMLNAIETYTGFDVLHDVADFTFFGNGQDGNAVLQIRGKFDPKQVVKVATNNDDHKSRMHGTDTIHTWTDDDNGKVNHASIFGGNTIIISEQSSNVELALDVLSKREESFKLTNPISVKAPVFLGLANVKKLHIPKDDEGAQMIKRAESIAISLREENHNLKVNAVIDTANDKTARQMKTFLDGLIALAKLASTDGEWDIGNHTIEQDGRAVKAVLTAPLKEVVQLLKKMQDKDAE